MIEAPPVPALPKRRKRRVWLFFGLGFLALAVLLALLFLGDVMSAARAYPRALAEARREGAIITPDDLRARYERGVENNAASVLRRLLDAPKDKPLAELNADRSAKPAARAYAANIVSRIGPLQDYLALTNSNFQYEWELGPNLPFPEFTKAKVLVKCLMIEAEVAVEKGDLARAETCFRVAHKVGQDLGQIPSLIAMLVRVAMESLIAQHAVDIGSYHPHKTEVIALLRRVLSPQQPIDFVRAMEGEMCTMWMVTDDPYRFGEGPSGKSRRSVNNPLIHNALRTRTLQWLRFTRREIDAHGLNWRKLWESFRAEEARLSRQPGKLSYLWVSNMPAYSDAAQAMAVSEVRRQMALAWLDLIEHSRSMPASVPEGYVDPYNGGPFLLRQVGNQLHIVSTGPNKIWEKKSKEGERGDDVTLGLRPAQLARLGW